MRSTKILFRLGLATLLGAILGIDRDLHRKPAGLRVLAMVGLGACGVVMASTLLDHSTSDGLLRSVQGVLTGICFLGAGVIMHAQGKETRYMVDHCGQRFDQCDCRRNMRCWTVSVGDQHLCNRLLLLIGGRWLERRIVG